MLKIKAKINFDIVEQFNVNPNPKFLFPDLPPAEVILSNDRITKKATRKDKKSFYEYIANDPAYTAFAEERIKESTREEKAA